MGFNSAFKGLIGKNETDIRQLFAETENTARKLGLQINKGKTKYMIVEGKTVQKKIKYDNKQ